MTTNTLEKEPVIDRSIVLDDYRFIEDGKTHSHELFRNGEWKPLIGVSSAVKDITNFGIASYYGARRTLMEIGYDPKKDFKNPEEEARQLEEARSVKETISKLEVEDVKKLLDKAYKAPSSYADKRAKKGSNSHDTLETWIKECIHKNGGLPMLSDIPVVQKFVAMTKHLEPKFIGSEKHGYNEELWIGGITDLIVETNIGMGIWDFKDRPAIYEKDILQMGGYVWLFPQYKFTHVLGIPLEGEEPRIFYAVEDLKKVYRSQLEVYKLMESMKK